MTWVLGLACVALVLVIAGAAENHRILVITGLATGLAAFWTLVGVGIAGMLS